MYLSSARAQGMRQGKRWCCDGEIEKFTLKAESVNSYLFSCSLRRRHDTFDAAIVCLERGEIVLVVGHDCKYVHT